MGKKLLVLTERFYPESFLVNELVSEFVARGFAVRVITQAPSYPADKLYPGYANRLLSVGWQFGARVYRVRTVLGYKRSLLRKVLNYLSFAVLTTAALIATGRRYDAVFVFHTGPLTLASSLYFVKGATGRRCLWTQDVWPDTVFEYGFPSKGAFAGLLTAFVRSLYRRFDSIAVTNPGFAKIVLRHAPSSTRVVYLPQWAPAELLTYAGGDGIGQREKRSDGEVLFRFAGTTGSMQNLERVIGGFAKAVEIKGNLRLEIIGDGSEKARLELLACDLGLSRVRFIGAMPMKNIMPYLKESDFLVLSLVGKGVVGRTIPAKFQAYLAAGRPVFGVVSGYLAETIEREHLGVVANPDDIDSIAGGFLKAAASSKEERERISSKEKEFLRTTFDKEKAITSFVGFLS